MSKEELIKCLLSYEASHHVIYLTNKNDDPFLSFHHFKQLLIDQYDDLIRAMNLNFNQIYFEIFDKDFQQFVTVDQHTKIGHLDKLKIIKRSNWNQLNCDENCNQNCNRSSCSNRSLNRTNQYSVNHRQDSVRDSQQDSVKENHQENHQDNLKDNSLDQELINKNKLNRNFNNSNQSTPLTSKLNLNRSNQLNNSNGALKNSSITSIQTDNDKRIIHLKDNLFKERCLKLESEHNKLIEENKRLLVRLEIYKKGSNNMANTTTYLDSMVTNTDELERLRKELTELKENQAGVIEGFKKKSNEFRRVVCKLTGFRFYALEQSKYKLNHIYSNPNEFLFFSYEKEEDAWNLFGNEFSEKFYEQIDTYLNEYDSYPAFLAAITLKLWEEERDKQQSIKK